MAGAALKRPTAVAFVVSRDAVPAVRVDDLAGEPALGLRADRNQAPLAAGIRSLEPLSIGFRRPMRHL